MRPFLESVKRFLCKENFDFNRGDIDIYNFHPQLCFLLAINGIFFKKGVSIFRYIGPFISLAVGVTAVVVEIMFFSHYLPVQEYSLAMECFYYFMRYSAIPIVFTSMVVNTSNLHSVIEKMNKDFLVICELGNREQFLYGQLRIWKMCAAWFSLVMLFCVVFTLFPFIALAYQTLLTTPDENTVRPLMFPVWLPNDDPYKTPNYEIFLAGGALVVISFAQTFGVYVYVLFHILMHYYTIVDMIILDFDVLFEGLEEKVISLSRHDPLRAQVQRELNKRIGKIVKMHQSVLEAIKTVSSIYGFPLMYQVSFSAPIICLATYEIAEELEKGHIDFFFMLLCVGDIIQLWVVCYLGTIMRNKAFAVEDACWNCKWHETSLGQLVRSDIILILSRAQEPVTIKFIGLPSVELETFSLMMTRAYSYFNMLRQYTSVKST